MTMGVFLIKSTACLAVFLLFHKVVLERESLHHFKRVFLLASLVLSFLIPNLVFTEYVDKIPLGDNSPVSITGNGTGTHAQSGSQGPGIPWEAVLWGIYLLGVVGFGLRFIRHLAQIHLRIRLNPRLREDCISWVLLRQALPPHTFFNYIFLNQKEFEKGRIPQEVLLHEKAHARQLHSLDVLFIELAQVILWFNPMIYLLKSSIKLNHEFLADRAVIDGNRDCSHYQNTLLSYLSGEGFEKRPSTGLANAVHYSSIKKRFTIMKTNTSKTSFALRSLLLLPLTALLLFGFAERHQVERETAKDKMIQTDPLDQGTVPLGEEIVVPDEILAEFGAATIDIEGVGMPPQSTASPKELREYNALAKKYNKMDRDHMFVKSKEVTRLKVLYGKMSKKQRAGAEPFPDVPSPPLAPTAPEPPKGIQAQPASLPTPPSPPSTVPVHDAVSPVPAPPAPVAPKSPLEHIRDMADKGAVFMYNGSEISAKEAIEVLQNHHSFHMDSRTSKGGKPMVLISTGPIEPKT